MRRAISLSVVWMILLGCSSEPETGVQPCVSGKDKCTDTCVDLQVSNLHCGECEAACSADQECISGECESKNPCAEGTSFCDDSCVDTQTDAGHCGQCDAACTVVETCVAGKCTPPEGCPDGEISCGGTCIDPLTAAMYCGAKADCEAANAGFACAADEVCTAGVCELSCADGMVICGGACTDPKTNPDYCGASADCAGDNAGSVCAAPSSCIDGGCACADGQVLCDGGCIDAKTSNAWCGAGADCLGENAGTVCGDDQSCTDGACKCAGGLEKCGEVCVDKQSDPLHCGACDDPCASGNACDSGVCISVSIAGVLSKTSAYWNYANVVGLDGAQAFCESNWTGSVVCEDAHLVTLGHSDSLTGLTDMDGEPVESFWSHLPNPEDFPPMIEDNDWNASCDGWAHGTGDIGPGGAWRPLENATGVIGPLEMTYCSSSRSVGCCFVAPE